MATQNQIVRLNEAGEMASEIVHEMGNHINILKAGINIMGAHIDKPELMNEIHSDLGMAIQRLEDEYKTIKAMAKGTEPSLIETSLEKALSCVSSYIDECYRERLTINIDRALKVKSSRAILFQIVVNLIKNAFQASPNCSVEITASDERSYITLTVKDSGNGMSPSQVENIFGNYSSNDGGTEIRGLGLQNVKRGISQINAEIKCISEQGVGTSFVIRLPKIDNM